MNYNFLLVILVVLTLIGVILWISVKKSNAIKTIPLIELNTRFVENNLDPIIINYVSSTPIITVTTVTSTNNVTGNTNPPAPNPSDPGTITIEPPGTDDSGGKATGAVFNVYTPPFFIPPKPTIRSDENKIGRYIKSQLKSINN